MNGAATGGPGATGRRCTVAGVSIYAPLDVAVITPRLELRGASDDLLAHLAPLVRSGKASDSPPPYDDPFWAYEQDPDVRVQKWLRGVWRARGTTGPGRWRLPLVVVLDDEPVGMQDLIGDQFDSFGTVKTFSWLSCDVRRRGVGTEVRAAVLHLAFAGFDAREAHGATSTTPVPTASRSVWGTSPTGPPGLSATVVPPSGSAGGCCAARGRRAGARTSP